MLNNHILEPLVHDFLHFIFISAYVNWTIIKIANLQCSKTTIAFIICYPCFLHFSKEQYLFSHEPKEPIAKETISIEHLLSMPNEIILF